MAVCHFDHHIRRRGTAQPDQADRGVDLVECQKCGAFHGVSQDGCPGCNIYQNAPVIESAS